MGMGFPKTARPELMTPTVRPVETFATRRRGFFCAGMRHDGKESGNGECLASVCIVDGTRVRGSHRINVHYDFCRAFRDHSGRNCREHHIAPAHAMDRLHRRIWSDRSDLPRWHGHRSARRKEEFLVERLDWIDGV